MSEILSLQRASSPSFTPRQVAFCDDLIGMGLAHLAIASLVLNVNMDQLNPSQVSAVKRLIQKRYKVLGYKTVDARHARTEFMASAVAAAGKRHRISVRIA